MIRKVIRRGIVLSGVVLFATLTTLASAEPASKWRIEFDHWADNVGELVLRVAPLNGTPIDVTTKVSKNQTENNVAKLVSGALQASLGKGYKVEVDDGEDVLIKKAGKTPKFEVTMVNSSVTGLNVKIKRD